MPDLNLAPSDIQAVGAAPEPAAPAPETSAPSRTNPAAMLELLPAEVLDNPMIFAVAKGQPGAISAPKYSKDPFVKSVIKHAEPLVAAGFGIYESIDKKTDVLFNTAAVDVGDLQEADQQGRLSEVAPSFDAVKTPGAAGAAPAAPGEAPAAPTAAPMAPESQPAPSVQNKLATQRTKNLMPTSPTGGPAPGAGQILNSILKQPI